MNKNKSILWFKATILGIAMLFILPAATRVEVTQASKIIYLPIVVNGGSTIPGPGSTFIETFDMDPSAPLPFSDPRWDASVHTRNYETRYDLKPMQAQHGPDCSPPPATHLIDAYEEAVYRCKNHAMTAIDDNNYAAITLTPNALINLSSGETTVRFDLSTARASKRDWVDIWVTPYEFNLTQPLQDYFPDLQGPPQEALLIEMTPENAFILTVFNNFQGTTYTWGVPGAKHWIGYDTFLEPSATRRDTFELRLRKDHVDFCMPDYDFCWMDIDLNAPLEWAQAIVQFSHHSYTAAKDCNYDGSCGPNTWHWDNIEIYPMFPFKIIHADRRFVEPGNNKVNFESPAPAGSYLRFSALGNYLEVSFDEGSSWQLATQQSQLLDDEGHFASYWVPIPAGTSTVTFKGDPWWGGDWHARNLSIWSINP